jgi:anaerobic selenocysteine-containing dehydrogenase
MKRTGQISFDDFKAALAPYTLDFTAAVAKGDPDEPLDAFKAKLVQLADLYCERGRKIVSYWTMGFNQHQRGTWVNEQCYMNHLLTGRQCAARRTAPSPSRASPPPAAPPGKWAPSPIACPPTWW